MNGWKVVVRLVAFIAVILFLVSCGGGGGAASDPDGGPGPSDPTNEPSSDPVAPDTLLVTEVPTKIVVYSITLEFSADQGDATFEASTDGSQFEAVASPHTWSALANGAHIILLRAVNAAGLADATPVSVEFTVEVDSDTPNAQVIAPSTRITKIEVGQSIDLIANVASSGGLTTVTWTIDGSGIPDLVGAQHDGVVFERAGIFPVSLVVNTEDGQTVKFEKERYIIVNEPAAYAPRIPRSALALRYVDSEESGTAARPGINAIDGDPTSVWHTEWSTTPAVLPHEIHLDLGEMYDVDGFAYLPRQDYLRNGDIGLYSFYVSEDGEDWGDPVIVGEFEQNKKEKVIRFPSKHGRFVRLVAFSEIDGRDFTVIAELGVFGRVHGAMFGPVVTSAEPATGASISVGDSLDFSVTVADRDSPQEAVRVLWDLPGTAIEAYWGLSPGPVEFVVPGVHVISAYSVDEGGRFARLPLQRTIRVLAEGETSDDWLISKQGWSILYADSEELNKVARPAANAIDGDPQTFWHSAWSLTELRHPHELQIDLGAPASLHSIRYWPRQDGDASGRVADYQIYVSENGRDWGSPVSVGRLPSGSSPQSIMFPPKIGQYVRFVVLSAPDGSNYTAMAELDVAGRCDTPFIAVISPDSRSVSKATDIGVAVSACMVGKAAAVRYTLDGARSLTAFTQPYGVTFASVDQGEHEIVAELLDAGGNALAGPGSRSVVEWVGVGSYYVAVGDSITVGVGDDIYSDNASKDGRNVGGGFTPILADELTASRGYPVHVAMEGIPGATSADGVASISSVLVKHKNASRVLIMYGTNDSGGVFPVPSGLDVGGQCLQKGSSGYAGTYLDRMQQILDAVVLAGKGPALAKIPYTLDEGRNAAIAGYNKVVDCLVVRNGIQIVPPDFYSYFTAHPEQFTDLLHPNGVGYRDGLAQGWFDALK